MNRNDFNVHMPPLLVGVEKESGDDATLSHEREDSGAKNISITPGPIHGIPHGTPPSDLSDSKLMLLYDTTCRHMCPWRVQELIQGLDEAKSSKEEKVVELAFEMAVRNLFELQTCTYSQQVELDLELVAIEGLCEQSNVDCE